MRQLRLLPFALLAVLAVAGGGAVSAQPAGEHPKTVVLGFDGVDAELTARWMDEGKLPNLAKLRQEGTFAPLPARVWDIDRPEDIDRWQRTLAQ